MKLFTKIALGISGFFFCVAAICLVAAIMMGGTLADVKKMVEDGKFTFGPEDGFHIQVWGDNGLDFDINLGDNQEEYTEREILHDCNKIYLEVAFGKIDIYYDDVEYVQVEQKNIPGFSVTTSESKRSLHIEGDLSVINTSGAELTIILPRDVKLEEVQMDAGASQVTIRDLVMEKFDFTIGAGQATISDVSASECDIEVGAGEAIVENLSVKELDVDAGVGKVDIEIAGAETDYNYDVECGIGAVTVGDRSFGGMGASQRITNNGAKHHMDIACGVGEITMRFICDVTDGTCEEASHNHN